MFWLQLDEDNLRIVGSFTCPRLTKAADEVELSYEDAVQAHDRAAVISDIFGRQVRVCGWYHTRPAARIAGPSHHDLLTNYWYQQIDPAFVGAVFSATLRKPENVATKFFQSIRKRVVPTPVFSAQSIEFVVNKTEVPWRSWNLGMIQDLAQIQMTEHEMELGSRPGPLNELDYIKSLVARDAQALLIYEKVSDE